MARPNVRDTGFLVLGVMPTARVPSGGLVGAKGLGVGLAYASGQTVWKPNAEAQAVHWRSFHQGTGAMVMGRALHACHNIATCPSGS